VELVIDDDSKEVWSYFEVREDLKDKCLKQIHGVNYKSSALDIRSKKIYSLWLFFDIKNKESISSESVCKELKEAYEDFYAKDETEAKKKAEEIAKKRNKKVGVVRIHPKNLYSDKRDDLWQVKLESISKEGFKIGDEVTYNGMKAKITGYYANDEEYEILVNGQYMFVPVSKLKK
jgi:vacuolar-type H+-ATPase subunit H